MLSFGDRSTEKSEDMNVHSHKLLSVADGKLGTAHTLGAASLGLTSGPAPPGPCRTQIAVDADVLGPGSP